MTLGGEQAWTGETDNARNEFRTQQQKGDSGLFHTQSHEHGEAGVGVGAREGDSNRDDCNEFCFQHTAHISRPCRCLIKGEE